MQDCKQSVAYIALALRNTEHKYVFDSSYGTGEVCGVLVEVAVWPAFRGVAGGFRRASGARN